MGTLAARRQDIKTPPQGLPGRRLGDFALGSFPGLGERLGPNPRSPV